MKINLHIGVHKTATTFLQNKLHANKASLHASGVGYMSLWDFRSFFTEKLMEFSPETFRLEDHIEKFFGGKKPDTVRGLLISEENLIGHCGGLLMSGHPFGSSRGRLAHLRTLFGEHEITMFCAVRSYDSFLSSAYCEGIRNASTYVPFDSFKDKLHWARMQWPYLIEGFEQNLRPEQTLLWRYEDFRNNSDRIIDALTFELGLQMVPPSGKNVEYPSFSKMTVDTLDTVSRNIGIEAANALISSVATTFPKSDQYPAFNPWGMNELKLMQRLYEQDVQAIDKSKWLLNQPKAAKVTRAA